MKCYAIRPMARRRDGVTLLEMLAAVMIIGIVALMVLPRVFDQSRDAKRNACHVNRENINNQAQLWFRNQAVWPSGPLADSIGADVEYFPGGFPTCPVDGTTYELDASTHQVIGHDH